MPWKFEVALKSPLRKEVRVILGERQMIRKKDGENRDEHIDGCILRVYFKRWVHLEAIV